MMCTAASTSVLLPDGAKQYHSYLKKSAMAKHRSRFFVNRTMTAAAATQNCMRDFAIE